MANENTLLEKVKKGLGITGSDLDATLGEYVDEVVGFLKDAGIAEANIPAGLVTRGVSDLWNYGNGEGKLSDYFFQRATQLSYKEG